MAKTIDLGLVRGARDGGNADTLGGNAASAFAPSGFGLGATGKHIDDCNAALESGFYSFSEPANAPFYYGVLINSKRNDDGSRVQIAISHAGEDKGCMAIRSMVGTDAQEWEFVNPRMQVNTEYRTAERFLGSPVYTKIIDCGTLTNEKRIETGINNVIRYGGRVYDLPIPFKTPNGSYGVEVEVNGGYVVFMVTGWSETGNAYLQLWYTK